MSLLNSIQGHQQIISRCLQGFSLHQSAQVFMFIGPQGIGKKKVARGLIQALVCEVNKPPMRACGHCGSCVRVAHGTSEAVYEVSPQGSQIKIEQSRAILDFLSLKSISKSRAVIIDEAHLMNLSAANSLLKILEEPPENTYFFLMAPSRSSVLSTIRSRVQMVTFQPLSLMELERVIAGQNIPPWALHSCRGSFEKLYEYIDDEEIAIRKKAIEVLSDFASDVDFLLNENWRDFVKDREVSQKMFFYWATCFRDAIYAKQGEENAILNVDQMDIIKKIMELPMDHLLWAFDQCIQIENDVTRNYDTQLLIEKFWVNYENALD